MVLQVHCVPAGAASPFIVAKSGFELAQEQLQLRSRQLNSRALGVAMKRTREALHCLLPFAHSGKGEAEITEDFRNVGGSAWG